MNGTDYDVVVVGGGRLGRLPSCRSARICARHDSWSIRRLPGRRPAGVGYGAVDGSGLLSHNGVGGGVRL